jgi:endogenous inhibitor of DNA gyrase (YacG/DUF329 family)
MTELLEREFGMLLERCDDIRSPAKAVYILCLLQSMVSEDVHGYRHAADCFCGGRQEWVDRGQWMNEGRAIAWIVEAVREKMEKEQEDG